MTTQLEHEQLSEEPELWYKVALNEVKQIIQGFISFNLIFLTLFAIETLLFPFLSKSVFLAFGLGALFLTGFSYFILLFYLQTKKAEQFLQIKDRFVQSCKLTPYGTASHLSLAEKLAKLASHLDQSVLSIRFSNHWQWLYKKDLANLKILLLTSAVEEHLLQIRLAPTDLEAHASLAQVYTTLFHQTLDPSFAQLALEELLIIKEYAPHDPWVSEQIAKGYSQLGKKQEEIAEMETLVKLRSHDKEILFRLGELYFKEGMNAKGLKVYEELRKSNIGAPLAENLVANYGKQKKSFR